MTRGELIEVVVGPIEEIDDPGCREFRIGDGDWPFKGFVVRQGEQVYAYQNFCVHAGHPLNWQPNDFLTEDGSRIVCASHGAMFRPDTGECAGGPCRGKSLRSVECVVRDGVVVVRGPSQL